MPEQRGVASQYRDEVLRAFERTSGACRPLLLKIRATDAQLAGRIVEFLDLAAGKSGSWSLDGSRIVFADSAGRARYDEIMQRLNVLAAEQADYQRQVVELSR